MNRKLMLCLLALFHHFILDTAVAQEFPLQRCIGELAAESPDCVYFNTNAPDSDSPTPDTPGLRAFRTAVGEPRSMLLGVALSGGGSKAAPFAMGVLAGLSDSGLLEMVDAVSTVSGGTYAAYFYFNRLIARSKMRANGEDVAEDYVRKQFHDCVIQYKSLPPFVNGKKINFCVGVRDPASPLNNLHQAFVRCRQDLLEPMDCNDDITRRDGTGVDTVIRLTTATLVSLPLHHFSNTLFDRAVNLSPTRAAYFAGIGSTYGLIPKTSDAIPLNSASRELASPTPRPEYFSNARMLDGVVTSVPYTFNDLQAASRDANRTHKTPGNVPLWIINAHGTKSRSAWGWLNASAPPNFDLDIFEFTPFSLGSGRYGYWNKPAQNLTLLDAALASAAFLDANRLDGSPPWKTLPALLLHGFNLSWGLDLPNWNISPQRAASHSASPIPLYWLDGAAAKTNAPTPQMKAAISSSYIRLADGGGADNLGAYSLISRGVENIVIADAAWDFDGKMEDVCALREQLSKRKNLHLHMPGLDSFGSHCDNQHDSRNNYRKGYPVRKWPYQVIAGCISSDRSDVKCLSEESLRHRIFLVKPAFDLDGFLARQAMPNTLVSDRDRNLASKAKFPFQVQTCTLPTVLDENDLPCETAGFILDHIESMRNCSGFPQHTTVLVTANSSAPLYGAYRELARHAVHRLGSDSKALKKVFMELLEDQRKLPIPRVDYCRQVQTLNSTPIY